MSPLKIAILVPICSRNQHYKNLEECPFYKIFFPQFHMTSESNLYDYKVFLGIDDDDRFYLSHIDKIRTDPIIDVTILERCTHHPVRAWNTLFEKAYLDNYDYFFQIGDDVGLQTCGWTSRFISRLQSQDNIGTVAPCELSNYIGRKNLGKPIVNENNFVSKKHYEIFKYFFFPDIKNWYCDDWITFVYGEKYASMMTDILCTNTIKGDRYQIADCPFLGFYINIGKNRLSSYLENHI